MLNLVSAREGLGPAVAVGIALGFSLAFSVASCGPAVRGPGAAGGGGANVVAKNVTTSEGIKLVAACTPTGPEICFNATDDNCNGVIDEGCGVGTGVLQFMIAWGESPADVDLAVTDPSGAKAHKANRSTSSGLQFDKDCPEDGCHGQNVENVFFEGNEPPKGKYEVEVKLADPHEAELPVKLNVSARVGNRTFAMTVELSPGPGHDKQTFAFEL